MTALKKYKEIVKNEDTMKGIDFHSIIDLNLKITAI